MITISHTHQDGTLVNGSRKGDGVLEILRGLYGNWRWFPSIQQIGIGQSRDKPAHTYKIYRAAEALRAAGHGVTVEINETVTRTFAEAEAERYERADDRAERLGRYADNANGRSEAAYKRSDDLSRRFEGGQPILIGHHSEKTSWNALRKSHDAMRRGADEAKVARHFENRRTAAEAYQDRRESVPTTLRRIKKLEAEDRQLVRRLNGTGLEMHGENVPANGRYAERLIMRLGRIAEEVAYWRDLVAKREAEGVKVWSKADFAKGDFVRFLGSWYEVLRVNAKSLSIPAMLNDGPVVRKGARLDWTDTIPYDEVTGRKSADEMAAILAAAS